MKLTLIALWALVLSSACNYRIFSNGKYSHKEKGLTSKWLANDDSCFVLEPTDSLPDSTVFIKQTTVLSPLFWLTIRPVNNLMIDQAKAEAKKAGANVIRITYKHATKFSRLKFETSLYSLKPPYQATYIRKLDSLKQANEKFCLIHLKVLSTALRNQPLYFNDSLVGYCPGKTIQNIYYPSAVPGMDFVFPVSGILSCSYYGDAMDKYGIRLERGGEFYLYLVLGRRGVVTFLSVDKHNW
jgi:hypothetical protein